MSEGIFEALRENQGKVSEAMREMARTAHPGMFFLVPSLRDWLDDPESVEVMYDRETDEVTIIDRR